MKTDLKELNPPDPLPDGAYEGTWGGYDVTFIVNGVTYRAKTDIGIRTPNARCTILVEAGRLSVRT